MALKDISAVIPYKTKKVWNIPLKPDMEPNKGGLQEYFLIDP